MLFLVPLVFLTFSTSSFGDSWHNTLLKEEYDLLQKYGPSRFWSKKVPNHELWRDGESWIVQRARETWFYLDPDLAQLAARLELIEEVLPLFMSCEENMNRKATVVESSYDFTRRDALFTEYKTFGVIVVLCLERGKTIQSLSEDASKRFRELRTSNVAKIAAGYNPNVRSPYLGTRLDSFNNEPREFWRRMPYFLEESTGVSHWDKSTAQAEALGDLADRLNGAIDFCEANEGLGFLKGDSVSIAVPCTLNQDLKWYCRATASYSCLHHSYIDRLLNGLRENIYKRTSGLIALLEKKPKDAEFYPISLRNLRKNWLEFASTRNYLKYKK